MFNYLFIGLGGIGILAISSFVYYKFKLNNIHIYRTDICVACQSEKPTVLYQPCGHLHYCQECSIKMCTSNNLQANICSSCKSKISHISIVSN